MKGLSTRTRILLAGLVPLVLFTVLLAHYFLWDRVQVQQQGFEQMGESYARELAAAARYGLFVGDEAELRQLAHSFVQRSHVHSVEIRSSGDRLAVLESGHDQDHRKERLLRSFTEQVLPQPVIALEQDPAFAAEYPDRVDAWPEQGTVTVTLTAHQARQESRALIANSLVLLLAALLLATGLLWRASRQIATPIESITGLVRQAATGKFEQRADTGAIGELARLEKGVNAMLDALQQHQEEMHRRIADATAELQTRNLQLEQARYEALQASRAKSEFLAHMSHEIRTPMNGILGFIELLTREPLDASQRTKVAFIRDAARELMAVIDQILDFSRIEAGRVDLAREPLDIRRIAADVCRLLAPQASERDVECRLEVSDSVPATLIGDPLRMRQILSNLVANAVKYTPQGSIQLAITADVAPGDFCLLILAVEDTGIGIAEADLDRIFDPFTQADIGDRRHYHGTGLGLAIVKRLADAMNASIRVASKLGQGSRFEVRVRLPVGAATRPEPADPNRDHKDDRLAGIRILSVDDNRINRHLLEAMLTEHGADVCSASSGAEGVAAARRESFDVVLMDIHMPGMDGIEASRRIRALDGYSHVPVLAVSADAVSRSLAETGIPQLSGYLIKPVEERPLVQAIENCVCGRGADHPADSRSPIATATEAGDAVPETIEPSVLVMFQQDLPVELAAIDSAFSARDRSRLHEALHRLKGAAAVCSVEPIYASINALQEAIRNDDMAAAEVCLRRLHDAADRMIGETSG